MEIKKYEQEYIIILPDWDGSATGSMGLKGTGKTAGLAVLDGQGNIVVVYQGSEPEAQVLEFL